MGVHGRKESIAQIHAVTEDPLSRSRHPKGLDVSEQGLHVVDGLWPLVPLDLVLRQEQADKALPGVSQLIAFNIEVGDGGVSAGVRSVWSGQGGKYHTVR